MNSDGLFTLEHELQNDAKYELTPVLFFPPIILWGGEK